MYFFGAPIKLAGPVTGCDDILFIHQKPMLLTAAMRTPRFNWFRNTLVELSYELEYRRVYSQIGLAVRYLLPSLWDGQKW